MKKWPLLLSLVGLLILGPHYLVPGEQDKPRSALVHEEVIAGGPKDFLEARHLVLRGSQAEIGKALTLIAKERLQVQPDRDSDPLRNRVQRKYFERHYPMHFERMQGAAAAFGLKFEDDRFNFAGLWYPPAEFGCSVVHLPPRATATGKSIVSRNYDFTLGTLRGTKPGPGEQPSTSRPFLVEMHPDRGYASLALHAYDLLGGTIDGINSEGLTVALLADDELMSKYPMRGTYAHAVGLGALQTIRFLLDTCANVEEAKEALLMTKQYYEMIPVHYLVADRHGKAFVWEYAHTHNLEHIIENPGQPLVTTNFSLHLYLEKGKPPSVEKARKVCPRYCILSEKLNSGEKITVEALKQTHRLVDATQPIPKSRPGGRTLWHALYFPEERKVQLSFYLRDAVDAAGKTTIERSEYREFVLTAKNGPAGDGKERR
jgi:hypothetical protein